MLDNEARQNLQTIRQIALQIWGPNCEFGENKVINSPYPEFELPMLLYGKIGVGIYYDRSALDIGIMQDGEYVLLGKFTTEDVFRGMKAMKPENLLHNFQVLDYVAREMIAKGET
jgi:hypothetical protein